MDTWKIIQNFFKISKLDSWLLLYGNSISVFGRLRPIIAEPIRSRTIRLHVPHFRDSIRSFARFYPNFLDSTRTYDYGTTHYTCNVKNWTAHASRIVTSVAIHFLTGSWNIRRTYINIIIAKSAKIERHRRRWLLKKKKKKRAKREQTMEREREKKGERKEMKNPRFPLCTASFRRRFKHRFRYRSWQARGSFDASLRQSVAAWRGSGERSNRIRRFRCSVTWPWSVAQPDGRAVWRPWMQRKDTMDTWTVAVRTCASNSCSTSCRTCCTLCTCSREPGRPCTSSGRLKTEGPS